MWHKPRWSNKVNLFTWRKFQSLSNIHAETIQVANIVERLKEQCRVTKSLQEAKKLHSEILQLSPAQDLNLTNEIFFMYIKCGSLKDARSVFDKMHMRKVAVWTQMIAAYAHIGHLQEPMQLFWRMQLEGVRPVWYTFKTLLNSCSCLGFVKLLHHRIVQCGYEFDMNLCNTLVHMYGKFHCEKEAERLFDSMREMNVVSWTSMLSAYARNGHHKKAMIIFRRMQQTGFEPDYVAFVTVLDSCDRLSELVTLHSSMIEKGFDQMLNAGNALVNMYAKCGDLKSAREVFDAMKNRDIISWNSILTAYSKSSSSIQVLELYRRMRVEDEHLSPSEVTFVAAVDACTSEGLLEEGISFHEKCLEFGLEKNVIVGTSLLNMYAKCGRFESALRVFESLPEQDDVLWTAIVTAASGCGFHRDVIRLFWRMQLESFKPDMVTLVLVLNSCACLRDVSTGRLIRAWTIEYRIVSNAMGTALVDMFGKCGCLGEAEKVFESLHSEDSGIWNALIDAYAHNGSTRQALNVFIQMRHEGVEPDGISFVVLLAACSHAGLVRSACEHYTSMIYDHFLSPRVEHCGCMIDLLGRVGWLEEAQKFVEKMKIAPSSALLNSLLSACNVHGDLDYGKWTVESVIRVEESTVLETSAPFVVFSNLLNP